MEHKHSNWPFLFIFLFIGYLYFTFEVVIPFGKKQEEFKYRCEQAGGVIIDNRNYPDLCFKKDSFIEIKQ